MNNKIEWKNHIKKIHEFFEWIVWFVFRFIFCYVFVDNEKRRRDEGEEKPWATDENNATRKIEINAANDENENENLTH